LDAGEKAITVFLDLQKAFDTVNHDLLIKKLNKRFGLADNALNIIISYLSNRCQKVRIDGCLSDSERVTCGVPQGTVLGPLFFLMYINDMNKLPLKGRFLCFADDTVLFCNSGTWETTFSYATHDINIIKKWLDSNKLSLNILKTNYIPYSYNTTGQPKEGNTIVIHNRNCEVNACLCPVIQRVKNTKYLGIIFDRFFTWTEHIELTYNRIKKVVYMFRRLRNLVPIYIIRMVYFALVQSLLGYGIVSWGGSYKGLLSKIHKAVNGLLRIIFKTPFFESAAPLYKLLNIPTIYHIYVEAILTAVNNKKIILQQRSVHEYGTRHSYLACVPLLKKYRSFHGPDIKAIYLVNSLPRSLLENLYSTSFLVKLKTWTRKLEIGELKNILYT